MKALQGSFEGLFQVSYHELFKETKHRTGVEGLISQKTFRGGYFQGKIGSVTPKVVGYPPFLVMRPRHATTPSATLQVKGWPWVY